jgi:hypothetical protein
LIYFSPLFCFLKTTLSFCYTLPLSQVQVHNASQTRRATLDRQDTRKEEMGLTRWCKLYLRYVVVDLQPVVWGKCPVPWCRSRASDGMMVLMLRKLSCKTGHTQG